MRLKDDEKKNSVIANCFSKIEEIDENYLNNFTKCVFFTAKSFKTGSSFAT